MRGGCEREGLGTARECEREDGASHPPSLLCRREGDCLATVCGCANFFVPSISISAVQFLQNTFYPGSSKKLKNKSLLACIWQMAGAVDGAKRRDHRAERECHESTLGGASSDDSGATTPRQKLRERRGGRPSESPSTRPGIAYTLAVRYRVRARPAILRARLSARPSTRVLRAVVLDAATICRTVGAGGATL